MASLPQSRQSRSLAAGGGLAAACVLSVLLVRGVQRPWIPDCPPYRQSGGLDARVVLVEFSDFQCPACAHSVGIVRGMKARYGDRLRVVFKHCPWENIHPWAKSAALAAECAGRQGKFWEVHDLLFEKQAQWVSSPKPNEALADLAESAKLEPGAFAQCLEDPASMALVESDVREAKERWIHSTPTFFINGRRFVGARQLQTLGKRAIERMLKG